MPLRGTLEREETEEDRLFSVPSREDELLAAAEAEAQLLRSGAQAPQEPPEIIERLGRLMALLGPRYRTLPREELWEKAVAGSSEVMNIIEIKSLLYIIIIILNYYIVLYFVYCIIVYSL